MVGGLRETGVCFRMQRWLGCAGQVGGMAGRERIEKDRRGINDHDKLSYTTITRTSQQYVLLTLLSDFLFIGTGVGIDAPLVI